MDLIEELSRLPSSWRYCAVNANKQPYQKNWQHNPLKRAELFTEDILELVDNHITETFYPHPIHQGENNNGKTRSSNKK